MTCDGFFRIASIFSQHLQEKTEKTTCDTTSVLSSGFCGVALLQTCCICQLRSKSSLGHHLHRLSHSLHRSHCAWLVIGVLLDAAKCGRLEPNCYEKYEDLELWINSSSQLSWLQDTAGFLRFIHGGEDTVQRPYKASTSHSSSFSITRCIRLAGRLTQNVKGKYRNSPTVSPTSVSASFKTSWESCGLFILNTLISVAVTWLPLEYWHIRSGGFELAWKT